MSFNKGFANFLLVSSKKFHKIIPERGLGAGANIFSDRMGTPQGKQALLQVYIDKSKMISLDQFPLIVGIGIKILNYLIEFLPANLQAFGQIILSKAEALGYF